MDGDPLSNPLCIICCDYLSPGDSSSIIVKHQEFKQFCKQLEDACLSSKLLTGSNCYSTNVLFKCLEEEEDARRRNALSVCSECRGWITAAANTRSEAELIEAHVLSLQLQLIESLKDLEKKMGKYLQQISWVGKVINESNEGRLLEAMMDEVESAGRRRQTRGRGKKQKTEDNGVVAFRDQILNVASKLKVHNANLGKKVDCNSGQDVKPIISEYKEDVSHRRGRGRPKGKKPNAKKSSANLTPVVAAVTTVNAQDIAATEESVVVCKVEVDMDDVNDYPSSPQNLEEDFQNQEMGDDDQEFSLNKVAGDNDNYSPSESEMDDNSDEDFIPKEPKYRRKDIGASSSSATSDLNTELEDLDLQKFSKFRRRIISRLKKKGKNKRNPELDTEFSVVKRDLWKKFPTAYQIDSGTLDISGVTVSINDASEMLVCSLCEYQAKPQGKTSKKDMYMDAAIWNHVVSKHLHGIRCPNCGKALQSLGHLRRHLKDHKAESLDCDICGKPLTSTKGMEEHKWTHLNEEEKQEWERQGKKRPRKSFKGEFICATCGKSFKMRTSLESHQLVHLPMEERDKEKVVCPDCGKSLFRSSLYTYHQKYACPANDNKPLGIPCEICGAVLKTSVLKKKHMRNMHGPDANSRPFSCDQCGKSFKTNGNLKLHLTYHLGGVAFYCSKGCGSSFKQKRNCQRHEKTCHKTAPPNKYEPVF